MRLVAACLVLGLAAQPSLAANIIQRGTPERSIFETAAWSVEISLVLREQWRKPVGAPVSLQPTIEIELDRRGHVIGARVERSSGNLTYDASVVHAIRKSSPLPIPKYLGEVPPRVRITFNPDPSKPVQVTTASAGQQQQPPASFAPTTYAPAQTSHSTTAVELAHFLEAATAGRSAVEYPPDSTTPQPGPPLMAAAQNERTPSAVAASLGRHRKAFLDLLNEYIRRPPGVTGGIYDVTLTIDQNGSVLSAAPSGETLKNPDLERRILQRIEKINFGPSGSGVAQIPYQFRFF